MMVFSGFPLAIFIASTSVSAETRVTTDHYVSEIGVDSTGDYGTLSDNFLANISAEDNILGTITEEYKVGNISDVKDSADGYREFGYSEQNGNVASGSESYVTPAGCTLVWGGWPPNLQHGGPISGVDTNGDSHISMFEAWTYAWDNDYARTHGYNDDPPETPQLSDISNLAYNTWFPKKV